MLFTELTDKAKETARDKWKETVFSESHDWEHVYSDATEVGSRLGIMMYDRHNRTIGGQKFSTPDISFSGFWSQGDGACWTGQFELHKMEKAIESVREHVSNLDEQDQLYSLAQTCERLYGEVNAFVVARRLDDAGSDPHPEFDFPDFDTMSIIRVNGKDHHSFSSKVDNESSEMPETFEEKFNELAEEFADWIYEQLEAEHDHLSSDETIDQTLIEGAYTFDEDGIMQ